MARRLVFGLVPSRGFRSFGIPVAVCVFNTMQRRAIFPALAEFIPSVVPYTVSVYAREEPPETPLKDRKRGDGYCSLVHWRRATGV